MKMCHYPDLGRASDWSCNVGTLLQTNWLKQRCCMTKHYPDLGSDTSSEWNFCASSSDVVFQGKQWWHFKMLAVFSGYEHYKVQTLILSVTPVLTALIFLSSSSISLSIFFSSSTVYCLSWCT